MTDIQHPLPPATLKPALKDAYPAFIQLIGHIRVHYVMDETWTPGATAGSSAITVMS
jgi:hypothetical protein